MALLSDFRPARRILVPTDFSRQTVRLVRYATRLAAANDAEVHLLHVLSVARFRGVYLGDSATEKQSQAMAETEGRVKDLLAEHAADHDSMVTLKTAVTWSLDSAHGILEYANAEEIDRIVLGSHGRSGLDYVHLGGVATRVVRNSPVPVLTIRRNQREFLDDAGEVRLRRILFPTDRSRASAAAAPLAYSLARSYDAELWAVHVERARESGSWVERLRSGRQPAVSDPPRPFDEAMRELFAGYAHLHVETLEGPAPKRLVAFAADQEIDLIVMASHGHSGWGGHTLGSVSEKLVRASPCAVCIVPSRPADREAAPRE